MTLSLILSVGMAGCRSSKLPEEPTVLWEHPVQVLQSCGHSGSLVLRLQDCATRNLFLARQMIQGHAALWQLAFFDETYRTSLWLHQPTKVLWSSPIRLHRSCGDYFPLINEGADWSYRKPHLEEYRQIFERDFALTMQRESARYFVHADFEAAGMIVDELTQKFRNPIDNVEMWQRCLLGERL